MQILQKTTLHDVLQTEKVEIEEYYDDIVLYMIVRCRGCSAIGFRMEFHDYSPGCMDADGERVFETKSLVFPNSIDGHHDLQGDWYVPTIVRKIYRDTLIAIQENAGVLAGLGLRSTIEAVCSDSGVRGKNLEEKISNLVVKGLIAKKDAERLHAIRFLGNDAAHEFKEPKQTQLMVALKIVEHLLNTVYVLPHEIIDELDSVVTEYKNFLPLLRDGLHDYKNGEELPLKRIIQRHFRRVKDTLPELEAELIKNIKEGLFTELEIGAAADVKTKNQSRTEQLFVIRLQEREEIYTN